MYYILDAGSGSYISAQITAGTSITPPSGYSAFRGMIAECSNFSSFYVRNYSNGGGYHNGLKNGVSTRIGGTGASQGYTFDISDYDYVYSCYSIYCDGYYQFS